MKVRTRFAPSPTGYLHIGGARTALFSWLFANKMGGDFLLRIEDTDIERSTKSAIDAIFEGMHWLGLESDEPVIYQTQRFSRYKDLIAQLLKEDKAYFCSCSRERLDQLRLTQQQNKQKPRYDGHCRDKQIKVGTPDCVVRFKNPKAGQVTVDDKVYGKVVFANSELDDLIIARTDGSPTYNFCVVVDDWDMKITHVIRGDDHLNNTPRQINILKALGAEIPIYAHVPMILGEDGKKLSKRQGALGVMHYRKLGILPQAMKNYLVRLGWSHKDQELFTEEELITLFDVDDINKSAAQLNMEKLLWVNQQYLKSYALTHIKKELLWHFEQLGISVGTMPDVEDIIELQRERVKTVSEMAEQSRYFYAPVESYDDKAASKFLNNESLHILTTALDLLNSLEHWSIEHLKELIQAILRALDLKMPQVAQPLRVALTGNTLSPSIDKTLFFIGKDIVEERIQKAINFIEKGA